MSVRISRESLLHALDSVQPGLAGSRETLEQSSCVIFSQGTIATFNDEISCRVPSPVNGKIEGAVKAAPLTALLRKMAEDEVQIDTAPGELVVVGKGRRAAVRMEADVLLPVESVPIPEEWEPLHEDFGDAIGVVHKCAGKDEDAFATTCVHIHPKWVEAFDNTQMCRWRLKTGVRESVLVRKNAIKHVTPLGMTEFAEDDAWIHFRNPNGLILSCRRYLEYEYRDLSTVMKVDGAKVILPKGLIEAAEKAAIFSADSTDEDEVLVELLPGKIRIKGQGVYGWYRETKKIAYDGEPIHFLVSPSLLSELVKQFSECLIASDRIKVDGGKFVYVSALGTPREKEEPEEETNDLGEEIRKTAAKARKAEKRRREGCDGEEEY